MTLHGHIKNGVVVLDNGASLAEGTPVEVRPVYSADAQPKAQAKAAQSNEQQVSKEQREALLSLIGIWKMNNPPSDEEVERIIEEERMKKYG